MKFVRAFAMMCLVLPTLFAQADDTSKPTAQYSEFESSVLKKANAFVDEPIRTVMDKTELPPSGDKHDHYGLSPYHWPNPNTPDGLPYIMKDGEVNPEANTDAYDRQSYFRMGDAVEYCTLAWQITLDPKYAKKAVAVMRAWFIDSATRMNPNLNYAQVSKGNNLGSQTGIIRGMTILELVRCVAVLKTSGEWSESNDTAWRAWLADFAKWLAESPLGIAESKAANNHGTWYDVQVSTFAFEGGNIELARKVLSEAGEKRIAKQVKASGEQTFELLRTKSWDYSVMNLDAMIQLAMLGKRVDVDLWNFTGEKGGNISAALDYLIPFATGEKAWDKKQIKDFNPAILYPLLRRAASEFPNAPYAAALTKFDPKASKVGLDHLKYPVLP